MESITYNKDLEKVTIGECLECYEKGVAVIMDEGSKVTFEVEER